MGLQSTFTGLQWTVSGLQSTFTGLQWTVSGLRWTFPALQWTFGGLRWTFSGLQWTFSGLQWTFSGLQWTFSGLRWTFPALQWTFAGLRWTFARLQWAFAGVQGAFAGPQWTLIVKLRGLAGRGRPLARRFRSQCAPGGTGAPSKAPVNWRMPAQSKKQQMAAGAALAARRGEAPKKSLKGASKEMEKSMSESQLEDLAHTKRKNLPETKSAQ